MGRLARDQITAASMIGNQVDWIPRLRDPKCKQLEPVSASFLAEISVRSPRKLFIFIKKIFSGSKYPKNILFNFVERSTRTCAFVLVKRGGMASIVVGGRVFDIADGTPNMYIVVYLHRVYKWYARYVHSIYGGPLAKRKKPKMTPANNYDGEMVVSRKSSWKSLATQRPVSWAWRAQDLVLSECAFCACFVCLSTWSGRSVWMSRSLLSRRRETQITCELFSVGRKRDGCG